jgi:hypothetical protein
MINVCALKFMTYSTSFFPKIPKSRHLTVLTSQLTTLLPREIGVGVGGGGGVYGNTKTKQLTFL